MNPIFEQLNQQNSVISGAERLKRTLNVNPRDYINEMIKSGKITQNQLDYATQIARNMGIKI